MTTSSREPYKEGMENHLIFLDTGNQIVEINLDGISRLL